MLLISIPIKWGPACGLIPLIIGILVKIYAICRKTEYKKEVNSILKNLAMIILIPILINNVNEIEIFIILLPLFLVIMVGIDHL